MQPCGSVENIETPVWLHVCFWWVYVVPLFFVTPLRLSFEHGGWIARPCDLAAPNAQHLITKTVIGYLHYIPVSAAGKCPAYCTGLRTIVLFTET